MNKREFEKSIGVINSSFINSKELIGANESHWKLFSSEVEDILNRLNSGESVTLKELKKVKDGWYSREPFIDERGRPFVLYIKDHSSARRFGSYRKSHMSWCKTLDTMERMGRLDRYHKKSDIENEFFDIIYGPRDEDKKKLDVCKNCLELMTRKVAPKSFSYTVANFNTKEFFDKWGMQNLKKPTGGIFPVPLPRDWSRISLEKRESAGWTCEKCGKNYVNNKHDLHTHHKNGVLGDIRRENLVVLCKKCHTEEPFHSHMKKYSANLNNNNIFQNTERVYTSTISKSQMNKLENFLKQPERYATGTEKAVQKVRDTQHSFYVIKHRLSKERQEEFSVAMGLYESKLKNLR